ncbi:MAG: hypothetical protein ACHREM_15085 [Polyangiales bacterium]
MALSRTAWLMIGGGACVALIAVGSRASAGSSSGASSPANAGARPPQYVWGAWTAEDFQQLAQIARALRMQPADLLAVLASESGLDPHRTNPANSDNPTATGLNQLTSMANDSVGITEAQRRYVRYLPVSEQLPLVYKYFASVGYTKAGKVYPNASTIYAANFAPNRIGSGSDDQVLYRREEGAPYEENKSLDREGKGTITIGDMTRQLDAVRSRSLYKTARAALQTYAGV